jgi:aminoglycoside phosphotransferase family enzyme
VFEGRETKLSEKLDFLLRAAAYCDGSKSVEAIETHFAWVFLTQRFAYKLKKPIRCRDVDFTTLAGRRANCELEIALNRRLAEDVYIGVVPLVRGARGLALEEDGEPVEWLVKMHRLPRDRMLDQVAARGPVAEADLVPVIDKLGAFYRRAVRAPWDGPTYRQQLVQQIERYVSELNASDLGMNRAHVDAAARSLLRFIREHAALLDARIAAGRVVDAHGDLRPEHVYLAAVPQIIDCLEFSARLRLLDTVEEVAFLALECERLGNRGLAGQLAELYERRCEDRVEPALWRFYRSCRALVRALLSAWHLRDGAPGDDAACRWRSRAIWYLDAAACPAAHARVRTVKEAQVRKVPRTAVPEDSASETAYSEECRIDRDSMRNGG